MRRRRAPRPFRAGGAPTRTPGNRGIELAPAAGDLQLARLRWPGTVRAPRAAETPAPASPQPEPRERPRVYTVNEVVPFSGIYNLVDAGGRYLNHQIACHRGTTFPPSRDRAVHDRPYGYELEFKAADLHRGEIAERHPDRSIHLPGEIVPVSGVYSVVDADGDDLGHQHALVEDNPFPVELDDPRAHGYILDYQARHLHDPQPRG